MPRAISSRTKYCSPSKTPFIPNRPTQRSSSSASVIRISGSNSIAANLLQRDADIAIRLFRPTQADLIARNVGALELGLYAHKEYLAQHPAPETLTDLEHHVLIGQDRDPSLIEAFREAGLPLRPEQFAFRCDNNIATLNATHAGLGIGPLHVGMAKGWPAMIRVLPDLAPTLELWLACHSDVRHNKRIRLVMDYLVAELTTPYAACPI